MYTLCVLCSETLKHMCCVICVVHTVHAFVLLHRKKKTASGHVTAPCDQFTGESQTALRLFSMAALVGRRALFQAFRVNTADRDSACRLAVSSYCTRQHVLSGGLPPASRGAGTRCYSSDSKDDLRVRYLDGEDSGKFSSRPHDLKYL